MDYDYHNYSSWMVGDYITLIREVNFQKRDGIEVPKYGTIYTIRKFTLCLLNRDLCLYLNEIENPKIENIGISMEPYFPSEFFRKITLPKTLVDCLTI